MGDETEVKPITFARPKTMPLLLFNRSSGAAITPLEQRLCGNDAIVESMDPASRDPPFPQWLGYRFAESTFPQIRRRSS